MEIYTVFIFFCQLPLRCPFTQDWIKPLFFRIINLFCQFQKIMPNYFQDLLRQNLKMVRKNLSSNYQREASEQICKKIKQLPSYRYAKHIALYHAIDGEIDLSNIWGSAPLQGKSCYFPALNQHQTLVFLPATPATPFHKNRYNIPEPAVDFSQAMDINNIDIMFIPLVAFDRYGGRLGMGAGYYDRSLSTHKPKLRLGIAYDFQQQTKILQQPWDITLQGIITPTQIYWSNEA